MEYLFRNANSNDAEEIGFVHYISWMETYSGLMPVEYLDKQSLEKSVEIAKKYPENKIVALVDNRVVGFVAYLEDSRSFASIKPSSEIMALYLLKKYHHNRLGYELMQVALNNVQKKDVILFVLKDNVNAINFYLKMGFQLTGNKIKKTVIGGELIELEMVLHR